MRVTPFALILAVLNIYGPPANAAELDARSAALEAVREDLRMPEPSADGRVPTLNKRGAMSPLLDPVSKAFVEFARTPGVRVLEIGASYGAACLEALKGGAKSYTANDLDARHLKILARRVLEADPAWLDNLKLAAGSFPGETSFGEAEYDAILIARVFQYMSPAEASEAVRHFKKYLKPGGRVYAALISPAAARTPFRTPPGNTPRLSLYDTAAARELFEKEGFVVEKCARITAFPGAAKKKEAGRKMIGVVARKPLLR